MDIARKRQEFAGRVGNMASEAGQLPKLEKPENLGFSADRLSRIDEYLEGYIKKGKLAGCSFALARNGKLCSYSAFGHADIERDVPMSADTIHRIYSMSKAITSVAILTLYEKGIFQLDDPVEKFLPEFADMKVLTGGTSMLPVTRPAQVLMTIRHLMTHTSGLTYGFPGVPQAVDQMYRRAEVGGPDKTLAEFTEKLATMPLLFDPGAKWNYSYSTDVLGRLVEVMSDQSFDEYLQEAIFGPLGMVDTGFRVPENSAPRFATNYNRNAGPLAVEDDARTSSYLEDRPMKSGGGGLVSTLPDYLRFAEMMVNEGSLDGARILGRKTAELMTMNHLPDGKDMEQMGGGLGEAPTLGTGFSLMGAVVIDPAQAPMMQSMGEFSWGGAAGTRFWCDREEQISAVFMTQFMPGGRYPINAYLRNLVNQAIVD